MKAKISNINLENIRISDRSFFLHYQIHSEPLLNSIKEIGVINPPMLQKASSGDYLRIVCGFRRVYAATRTGIGELDCCVLPSEIEDRDLLLFSLHDNITTQPLHPLEKSIVIKKLETFFQRREIIEKYLGLLQLSPHEKSYKETAPLAGLEGDLQDALYRGDLAQPVAVRLSGLDRGGRLAVFHVLDNAHLSFSKQKEVTQYLLEISARESLSVRDLAGSDPVREVVENNDLSRPQKGEHIRGILRKRRFPELTSFDEKFSQIRRSLKLGDNIKLAPPPSFEGDSYKIQFEVNSEEDLCEKIRKLKKTRDNPGWKELFEL